MKRAVAERLEALADGLASASLGGAVGLSAYHLLASAVAQPALGACAAAAAAAAFWAGRSLLGLVERRLPVAPIAAGAAGDELSAEDDSPVVVRLFDPAVAAAPGPSARWQDGLANDFSRAAPADGSRSLHDALHQLRQTLASRR
jgi:hypothetical protein